MHHKFIVNIDGGSRGNPGPSAIGIFINSGKEVLKDSKYIGIATNNQAEYQAAIFALQKIKARWGKKTVKESLVEIFTDSELLVKQVNSQDKIKKPELQKLFIELWNLKVDFKQVDFEYVPREKSKEADSLVNKELDRRSNNKI